MHNYYYLAASVLSLVTFSVHVFVGSSRVAAPLLASKELAFAAKWLNYYCWHITSIYTFLMGGAYAYVAANPDKVELVLFVSLLNSCFSILSAAVALKAKINPLRFPSTSLFAGVAILGFCGI